MTLQPDIVNGVGCLACFLWKDNDLGPPFVLYLILVVGNIFRVLLSHLLGSEVFVMLVVVVDGGLVPNPSCCIMVLVATLLAFWHDCK